MDKEEATVTEIAPAAQRFLREHIRSLWQLELILFLKEEGKALSASEIAANLYSHPRIIEGALSGFAKTGILKVEQRQPAVYVYDPGTSELTEAIEQAGAAYANKRLAVINFIFSRRNGEDA